MILLLHFARRALPALGKLSNLGARHALGLLAAALALLLALPAIAADHDTPQTEIEAGYGEARLSSRSSNWRNIFVDANHPFKNLKLPSSGLRETRRFGLSGNEVYGGLYYPLAPTWTGLFEGSLSPVHEAPPEYTLGAQLQKILPYGWIAGVGFRHNEYTRSASHVRTFSLERYWGDFHSTYTLFSGKPEGGAHASAHRFQVNYYYGNASAMGIAYTTGRDMENLGLTAALLATDVRNWTLSGRHWFARDWAVTYEALANRQGGPYPREGLRLGLRYRF
ncbi:MAG TPA: YaiO family outer membrane beta-barrel protein [Burkholderiales bacterium]|nr:YaiO family outer membrane beta-barrel protein [Burkholderiales bacterium]